MVDFTFNAQQYTPEFGGGGEQLPPGEYKVVIVDSRREATKDGQGGMLSFDMTPVEGPLAGRKQTMRFNLHHHNAQTVEIANKQLSALCHVVGVFAFNRTEDLHNKPFKVKIDFQKGHEPTQEKPNGGYTEVKALFDVNGHKPGQAAQGGQPMQHAPQNNGPAPGGVQQQGAGWGGAPQGQQQQQPQPPAQQQQGGQQGGWGGAPQQNGQQQQQQQQQQPNNGGGWGGAPQGGANNAPQGWGNS
jgi:hypothetical protein